MAETTDRLNQARHGLLMIAAITIIAAVVLAASTAADPRDSLEMTGRLIKMLNLSTPTLFPTGHALRDAGYAHPAVDLRYSPHLPTTAVTAPEIRFGSPAANQRNTQ
jgi:hypothetical protein